MVLMKKTTQHLRLILIEVRWVATINVNPARHTSKANGSGRGGYNRYLVGKMQ